MDRKKSKEPPIYISSQTIDSDCKNQLKKFNPQR